MVDRENFNIVPTWVSLGGNNLKITIAVNNLGLGPDFSFIYTGTYNPLTPIPGATSLLILTISGTYSSVGIVSACSLTTESSLGNFVATFLPTISSGTVIDSLYDITADNNSEFTSPVMTTITFSAPPVDGQIAGTVALASNPTFNFNDCFATTGSVVNPLTINATKSNQSGAGEYMFAEGFDPHEVPTTLFLNGFSANVYPGPNTDPNASQISSTDWAVVAAIGEDNVTAAPAGVSNDGKNDTMVFLYGVLGGACNGAGGVDAPFHFLSGKPIVHKHKKHPRHNDRDVPNHGRGRTRDD